MKIVSTNGATVLNVDGIEYVAESGGFEVPQELGERLVKGPAFERDYIALDKASAAEKAAAESRDGILARIEALEAAVFPDRAPEPTPVPATPASEPVPSAPEAPEEAEPEPVVTEEVLADPEPVVEPAPEVPDAPVEDVPVQSDASPVDAPPISEPDAPVDIPPVETPVESEPVEAPVEDVPAVVEVPAVDPAAE